MNLIDALIAQSPSLALQRAAADEIARLIYENEKLRQELAQQLAAFEKGSTNAQLRRANVSDTPIEDSIKAAHYERTRKKEPPPWWPAVEAILNEHGLQAIDFVADFKAAMKQGEQKARADLEADLAATRELAEGYAQERNELKDENARREAEMQEQCRIIGMGGQREAKLLADNERLRASLRNLLAYANSLEMHDAGADGEHHVMQAARAALGEDVNREASQEHADALRKINTQEVLCA